jgi:adenylate cyclase
MKAEQKRRDLRDWILDKGHMTGDLGDFVGKLAEKLVVAGIPIYRLTSGIPILHPLIRAETAIWIEGEGVTWRQFPVKLANEKMFTNSPLFQVYKKGETVRFSVGPDAVPGEFSILEDLRAEGAVDYVAFPLRFSDGSFKSLTLATRRAGGFSDADIAILESILRPISLVFEIHTQRRSAVTLLGTYLGHRTAPRVLAGEIQRGDGQQIESVIWFSDLRDFTGLSGRFDARQLVDVLDFYFESMINPVAENGGEVLKFIGDAVLAIFTFADEAEARKAASQALKAAHSALTNLNGFAQTELAGTVERLAVGISLHMGAVYYGNVGGGDRLDFTVIGEAVNVGSRINGLSRDLGHPILASEDFVEYVDSPFVEAGSYELRGVRLPQRVYFPAPAHMAATAKLAHSGISSP